MEKQKVGKKELAKESLKALRDLEATTRIGDVIKDNKIKFQSGGKTFRMRRLTLREQEEVDNVRRKKHFELINDDSYLFRKQWIEKYKQKGIDIEKIETNIRTKEDEIKKLLLRLAKMSEKKEIDKIKEDILALRDEQDVLTIQKTDLLSYSIEDQLTITVNSYTCYLILEKKDGNKWIRHFESYKDFLDSNDADLIGKSFYYLSLLMYGEM